ncbi:kinase-like domain-containing protein [Schizophyllum amplum]|uniref:cyclin-dependent kinase n=1 Tax=Schizophyllum amplum TaxID=97359 RepID=A0A550D0L7_9AGAR|nr:kinase-like domain-containing protein [Auriculariopsis ampla]
MKGLQTSNEPIVIAEGIASSVAKVHGRVGSQPQQLLAVKSSTLHKRFAKEPHDILKELRILSVLSHPNVIPLLHHEKGRDELRLFLPYIPFSLSQVLSSPYFSPHVYPPYLRPDENAIAERRDRFCAVARSLMAQALLALAYLHDEHHIAHRDIKPANLLITPEGAVQLIDFGIARRDTDTEEDMKDDLWPESRDRMYFEVSTGAYRAPELLFGPRTYDPFAIDMWSLGATFAEFFTSLSLYLDDDNDGFPEDEDAVEDEEDARPVAFHVPRFLRIGYPGSKWARETLFNGSRGEIGLAWSIFKIRGTPTPELWPTFTDLPDAQRVNFNVVPRQPLVDFLPNLPSQSPETRSAALDLVDKLLAYPQTERLRPKDALRHPWFKTSAILLPRGFPANVARQYLGEDVELTHGRNGKSLAGWVKFYTDP